MSEVDQFAALREKVRSEIRGLDPIFQNGLVVTNYEKADPTIETAVRGFHTLLSHLFTSVWQETNVTGLSSLERFEIVRQFFGMAKLPEYVREISSPYSNRFSLVGVSQDGENALITFKQQAVTARKREPVTEWVQVDAETKKLQPKLDENNQPVFKDSKGKEEILNITYKVKLDFLVNLLIETGRPSIVKPAPADYIPAPLETDVSVMLQFLLTNASGVTTPPMGRGRPFMSRGRGPDMWCDMPPWSFMRAPPPCRVFLKPDDKGRMEVIFEPYTQAQIEENRRLIAKATAWAEWRIESAPSVSMLVSQISEAVRQAKKAKAKKAKATA